ncbi:unnamed protein product, partial [Allacma fusca]
MLTYEFLENEIEVLNVQVDNNEAQVQETVTASAAKAKQHEHFVDEQVIETSSPNSAEKLIPVSTVSKAPTMQQRTPQQVPSSTTLLKTKEVVICTPKGNYLADIPVDADSAKVVIKGSSK